MFAHTHVVGRPRMGFLPVSRHSIVKTASRKRDRQRTFQNEEGRAGRAWPSVPRRGAPRVKATRRGPGRPPAAGRDVDVKRERNVTLIRNRDRACAPCACANTCTRSDTIPPVSRSRSGSSGRSHALACTGAMPGGRGEEQGFYPSLRAPPDFRSIIVCQGRVLPSYYKKARFQ